MRFSRMVALVLLLATAAACGSTSGAAQPRATRPRSPGPSAAPAHEPSLAFTRLSGAYWSIDTVTADGRDVRHLVAIARADAKLFGGALDSVGQADWSPDRSELAFTCVTTRSSICVSTPEGSHAVVLRLPAGLVAAVHPHWSPDGTRIAFAGVTSTTPLHSQIEVMNADGSDVHRITNLAAGATDPTWSPDGKHIAFQSLDGDIWVMNADGTAARALRHTTAEELEPAWSPDGTRIAFSAVVGQSGATTAPTGLNGSSIYVMHDDGRFPTQLTAPGVAVWPAWSPDGREIAFTCNSLTKSDLCVVNADGSNERTLLGGPHLDMQPAW
ncbi:MAG TPA: hypothetical protein VID47_14885 [Actinomycetota bacterium]